MAIVLEANYAKKLGLPGYSSHQYSVSIRTELTDLSQLGQESSQLYRQLQDAVDQSIQHVGFIPGPATYGMNGHAAPIEAQTGNGHHPATGNGNGAWRCSDRQRELIENLVTEHQLDKNEVEAIARERFDLGVRQLDRLQASGLIDELLERCGNGNSHPRNGVAPTSNGSHRASLATTAAKVRSVAKTRTGGTTK